MPNQKISALAPMLAALKVKQKVSFDECFALWRELHATCGNAPPNFELSGNQWTALVNLAVSRFGHRQGGAA